MSLFSFVKAHVPILDVVAHYVPLKQMGGYWKGSCPFHSETDASFTVSPDKQIFYCFGCHAAGDVISFIEKIENLSPIESAKHLVEINQLVVPDDIAKEARTSFAHHEQKDFYFRLCKAMAEWTHQQLLSSGAAQKYLLDRSISVDSLKTFMIGYFPGGVQAVTHFTKDLSTQGFLVKDLVEYGILQEGRSTLYSPFEERIIFPIKDPLGRFCGFGGRIFKTGDERPKYYNSRESEGFIKGKLLFGFDRAKKALHDASHGFLVEGYMDCITMVQHGFANTIATLGTACTIDHLKLLARVIKVLYVVYDGDKAGQNAIVRLTELCWEVNLELRVIQLPAKEDPASFLAKGNDLTPLLAQAQDIFTFFIATVGHDFTQKTLSEKMTLAEKIFSLIAHIPDEFKQALLLQHASTILQVPLDTIKTQLKKQTLAAHKIAAKRPPEVEQSPQENTLIKSPFDEVSLLEEKIFSVILASYDSEAKLQIELELIPYFSHSLQQLFEKLAQHEQSSPAKGFTHFLETLAHDERDWVIKVSMKYQSKATQESFAQLLSLFCKHHWKQIVQNIKQEMLHAKRQNDVVHLNTLFGKFLRLKQGIQSRGLI